MALSKLNYLQKAPFSHTVTREGWEGAWASTQEYEERHDSVHSTTIKGQDESEMTWLGKSKETSPKKRLSQGLRREQRST